MAAGSHTSKAKTTEDGIGFTLAALMCLYGMKPRPIGDGTWEARHPTALRRDAVVHIDSTLTQWWIEHPFVDRKREGGLFGFICWVEGCGMLGVAHMVREEYPRLLAEAGIPPDFGLDSGESGFVKELRRDESGSVKELRRDEEG
jgi:hypothetical protein